MGAVGASTFSTHNYQCMLTYTIFYFVGDDSKPTYLLKLNKRTIGHDIDKHKLKRIPLLILKCVSSLINLSQFFTLILESYNCKLHLQIKYFVAAY